VIDLLAAIFLIYNYEWISLQVLIVAEV